MMMLIASWTKILDRCIERNVFLKFSKTWLGFNQAKFFGYIVKHGSYELGQERKDALKAIPFPTSTKQMQSFLGAALFFKPFVANYSAVAAPLNDMVRKDFNWDPTTWKVDYKAIFDAFKQTLQSSVAIFYPDYLLRWLLRTDASLRGVGAVLYQIFVDGDGNEILQPIGFCSQKFSPQATRWTTIEQEAYGVYFGVKYFSYYLLCKPFILETDHNNLIWMEASLVPKIIRWRVYLQSFNFLIRHISGKLNFLADYLSRLGESDDDALVESVSSAKLVQFLSEGETEDKADTSSFPPIAPDSAEMPVPIQTVPEVMPAPPSEYIDPDELLSRVHGGRMGHHGARETWKELNRLFAGRHRIPYRLVQEFVAKCAICQKDRLGMVDSLEPIILHLIPTHQRSRVGVDTLTVTPPDKDGNCYLIVIVNHSTKLAVLFPVKTHTALVVATALFQYCCSYGLFDSLISDPGSEFNNEVVSHLNRWFGIRHMFSLVDRHESNGVEGTNKHILRHLKALVFDERVKDRWSSPTVLPLIQFMLNSHVHAETGIVPFHAHFGSADATYFRMPEEVEGDSMRHTHAYIRLLDANLKVLREISKKHQDSLIQKRTSKTPQDRQNVYQPGDLVFFQRNTSEHLPTKLSAKFIGPFEVLEQVKNDVKCRHVIMGNVQTFHVTRLKIFHGGMEEAKRVAVLDNDQFEIRKFVAYKGNPEKRTTMEFEVLFEDGSLVWLPWSKDIFDTVQYEEYCRSRPELIPLVYDAKKAAEAIQICNRTPITEVGPGDTVYVNIRSYGATWYSKLPLPDLFHTDYVVEYFYRHFANKRKTQIVAECKVFNEKHTVNHDFVKRYGSNKNIPSDTDATVKVVDEVMVRDYPELLC